MKKGEPCLIDGCTLLSHGHGLCATHLARLRRTGTTSPRVTPTPMERFLSSLRHEGECWVWTGGRSHDGYGRMSVGGRQVRMHRWAYEQMVGPIPDGLLVCHRCDNPPCVNPRHLFVGNHKDNADDMVKKGRGRYTVLVGEANSNAKLTGAAVGEIRHRHASGETATALASVFGVSRSLVGAVVRGERWAVFPDADETTRANLAMFVDMAERREEAAS